MRRAYSVIVAVFIFALAGAAVSQTKAGRPQAVPNSFKVLVYGTDAK